jgi:hypothetical protein
LCIGNPDMAESKTVLTRVLLACALPGAAIAQARKVAEVIQRDRPDVLLINEFDCVPGNRAANLIRNNYLRHVLVPSW